MIRMFLFPGMGSLGPPPLLEISPIFFSLRLPRPLCTGLPPTASTAGNSIETTDGLIQKLRPESHSGDGGEQCRGRGRGLRRKSYEERWAACFGRGFFARITAPKVRAIYGSVAMEYDIQTFTLVREGKKRRKTLTPK